MGPVNLKLLHMFVAVAENRSFRMTAEQLGRSQSAVSLQIKQLEEQVGVSLFHRMQQGDKNSCATCAYRMPQGNGPAVDVYFLNIQSQDFIYCKVYNRKRFVDFEQIYVFFF